MSKLTPYIEAILQENPKARDSDKELIIELLQMHGANLTPNQLEIFKEISFESVTRCRRKLQEQGKYLPSPEVAKQRRLKSYIVQQNAPTAKPERLQHLVEHQPEILTMEDIL